MKTNDVWNEFSNGSVGKTDNGHILRKMSSFGAFLGVESISGLRVFVLELSDKSITKILETFPKWKGIEIYPLKLSYSTVGLCLKSLKDINNNVFGSLVEDLLSEIYKTSTKEEFEQIAISRIHRWFDFFKISGGDSLSFSKQTGLFGELYFLSKTLIPKIGKEDAINAWVGPEGKYQDFSFIKGNLELKTTLSKEHRKILISSEKQLNWKEFENLFLGICSIIESKSRGISLKQLVNYCRDQFKINSLLLETFNTKLEAVGYHDIHDKKYDKTFWKVTTLETFFIGEGFPCITDVPNGLGDLNYSIMISSFRNYEVPFDDAINTLTAHG